MREIKKMREIKFKAKNLKGQWVEGFYWNIENNHYIKTIINWGNCSSLEDVEVNPNTLCQYIGLKDENEQEIYENDIVYCEFYEEEGNIVYDDTLAMFVISFDGWCTDFDHIDSKWIEVRRNIFD